MKIYMVFDTNFGNFEEDVYEDETEANDRCQELQKHNKELYGGRYHWVVKTLTLIPPRRYPKLKPTTKERV